MDIKNIYKYYTENNLKLITRLYSNLQANIFKYYKVQDDEYNITYICYKDIFIGNYESDDLAIYTYYIIIGFHVRVI